jgi:tight adherence protein C
LDDLLTNQYFMMILAVLAALAVLSLAGSIYFAMKRRDPAYRRLMRLSGRSSGADGEHQPALGLRSQLQQGLNGLINRMAELSKPKQSWQMSKLQAQLVQAGYRSPMAANIMLAVRLFLAVIFPLLVFVSPLLAKAKPSMIPVFLIGAAIVGFMLPNYYVRGKVSSRQQKISRELPDVLDLLAISVEAGLGLDAAISRVSKEMAVSSPTLGAELKFTSLELRAGIPRAMALKNLGARCGVDEVTSLVAMLNQADRFGVSVGRSLRVHSDTVRTKRRQKVEEMAAKIPLKLLFPVLFLIFPAIMAVMAGPAILKVMESFGGG